MIDNPTILIVDDEPANIQVLAACLKHRYRIKVAISGQQCLAMLAEQEKPDLILLDIEMPGMNGYEVCEKLKSDPHMSIPIIFVTARDAVDDEERGLNLGAVDYITKPVSPAIVEARVNTHMMIKNQRDQLEQMALHDQLTGLYNRYYLLEEANHKVALSRRHKYELSLLMLDIDYFKAINDQHGHPVGDAVLKKVASLLIDLGRTEDVIARFGGEEFVVVLDHCNAANAEIKANNIREKIEALKPDGINVTVSIGVAQLNGDDDGFTGMLKRADDAVYQAKEQGRNRVVLSEDLAMTLTD